jgi:hypothetical protein
LGGAVTTEGTPRAFDELRRGEAGALCGGGFEDGVDAGEALKGRIREQVAAFGDEPPDGVALSGGVV